MLVSMKEMLADAKINRYAIPAFDVSNYEMMKAVLDVCEEERSPALLMGLGVDLAGKGLPLITSMVRAASDYYTVPVCFHLDHATDFESIKAAIEAGFSSVMFDGSVLPFEDNANKTAEITAFAHARGVTVEAELGHVGNAMVGNVNDSAKNEDPEDTLTLPDEVVKFVEMTDIDALAIAIGTAHGVYLKTPTLRIDRLDEITAVCDRPLVLHGGSGTPDDQMKMAIEHGITKINIYSDVVGALNTGLKNKLNTLENPSTWPAFVFEDARKGMKEAIRAKIHAFGSAGRV
ncbi:MAG: class II fructose-bisphosphate aldolase [Clostridia bacterium]|nr:class II fructose-bisphosphate aldolase [Clostridia bacterium]